MTVDYPDPVDALRIEMRQGMAGTNQRITSANERLDALADLFENLARTVDAMDSATTQRIAMLEAKVAEQAAEIDTLRSSLFLHNFVLREIVQRS